MRRDYHVRALLAQRKALLRVWRAYFARPDLLTDAHTDHLVYMARMAARLSRFVTADFVEPFPRF